ncbi:unnamed protein product [Lactuca virosa]|uniref:Uncharacterized protein n=1 Tax=Lactuca virosa TaxID=75947 RepID=A0AAU9NCM7_9ASTR|nr:unnamed protein product [Lactuca virosa]
MVAIVICTYEGRLVKSINLIVSHQIFDDNFWIYLSFNAPIQELSDSSLKDNLYSLIRGVFKHKLVSNRRRNKGKILLMVAAKKKNNKKCLAKSHNRRYWINGCRDSECLPIFFYKKKYPCGRMMLLHFNMLLKC